MEVSSILAKGRGTLPAEGLPDADSGAGEAEDEEVVVSTSASNKQQSGDHSSFVDGVGSTDSEAIGVGAPADEEVGLDASASSKQQLFPLRSGEDTPLGYSEVVADSGAVGHVKPVDEEKQLDHGLQTWEMNMFDAVFEMLDVSEMIYTTVAIRQLAREGKLNDAEGITEVPIQSIDWLKFIKTNVDSLKKLLGEGEVDIFLDSVHHLKERMEKRVEERGISLEDVEAIKEATPRAVVVHDDNHLKELVYAIGLNKLSRRVDVIFRGSVTLQDWKTDLRFEFKTIPNPLKETSGLPDELRVHAGFYQYLYDPKANLVKENDSGDRSKFDMILEEVLDLLEQHPGSHLYVTGHSLGGALATLFSFSVAALGDPRIGPVTCVSVAAPMVGNSEFHKVHQYLEEQGRLRHLRVVNTQDIVPMGPVLPFCWTIPLMVYRPSALFQHAGVQLKLHKGQRNFNLSYTKYQTGCSQFWTTFWDRLQKSLLALFLFVFSPFVAVEYSEFHRCREYSSRIQANSQILKKLSLPVLYQSFLDANTDRTRGGEQKEEGKG